MTVVLINSIHNTHTYDLLQFGVMFSSILFISVTVNTGIYKHSETNCFVHLELCVWPINIH